MTDRRVIHAIPRMPKTTGTPDAIVEKRSTMLADDLSRIEKTERQQREIERQRELTRLREIARFD